MNQVVHQRSLEIPSILLEAFLPWVTWGEGLESGFPPLPFSFFVARSWTQPIFKFNFVLSYSLTTPNTHSVFRELLGWMDWQTPKALFAKLCNLGKSTEGVPNVFCSLLAWAEPSQTHRKDHFLRFKVFLPSSPPPSPLPPVTCRLWISFSEIKAWTFI